jgi:alpha-L-fucosidase
VDDLVELYFTSVGRNGKLLLNVPPMREGLIHPTDVARLAGFHEARARLFEHDLAASAQRETAREGSLTYTLPRAERIAIIRLAEDIERGQCVSRFTVEGSNDWGEWHTLASGTTIGYARLLRLAPSMVRRVRVRIDETIGSPARVGVQLFAG